MSNFFVTIKKFYGYPCVHRQWNAESHCKYLHGYSRDFIFEFSCSQLTKEMWVIDFGGLKRVKDWLSYMFDHTLLVSENDPEIELFQSMNAKGIVQLRVFKNVNMEGTAEFVYTEMNPVIKEMTNDRAWITRVEVRENVKNSSAFIPLKRE